MKQKYLDTSLLLIMFFFSCAAPGSSSADMKQAVIILPNGDEIGAEIADTSESRTQGLMFRDHLEANRGMLFVFGGDGFHSMWMKNCKIPLDIIWLNGDGKIVHIEHAAQPCPESGDCKALSPFKKSRYVLEVNAGTAERSSLKQGDQLLLLGIHSKED